MMRDRKLILIFVIIALAVGGIVVLKTHRHPLRTHSQGEATYYCPMHPQIISDRPGDCPICYMKLVKKEETTMPIPQAPKEKKILYWTDPMILGYKSDKPGKSPMGMDLIAVYEEASTVSLMAPSPQGYTSVTLTPQRQQLIGIKTASAQRKYLTKTIRAVGTIAHDPELYQAQTEYIQAVKAWQRSQRSDIPEIVDQAKRLVDSTRMRLKHMGLSDALIDEIAAWDEPEHSLIIARPGQPVWMYAYIYEFELPFVSPGQAMQVEVPSISGEILEGKVLSIDLMVDAMTRTVRIRGKINDPRGYLKPDMFVNVTLMADLGETLTIPVEAVFHTGTRDIVFVDDGRGTFQPRDVKLGTKTEEDYEVVSGIQEGETVVTSGNFLIDSESRLKAALEGVSGGGAHGAHGSSSMSPQEQNVAPASQPQRSHGGH